VERRGGGTGGGRGGGGGGGGGGRHPRTSAERSTGAPSRGSSNCAAAPPAPSDSSVHRAPSPALELTSRKSTPAPAPWEPLPPAPAPAPPRGAPSGRTPAQRSDSRPEVPGGMYGVRDAACPLSTRRGTRLVRLVRGRGGGACPSPPARALHHVQSPLRPAPRARSAPPARSGKGTRRVQLVRRD